MTGVKQGSGVQVVFVEEDGTYSVDNEALQRVLSNSQARDLPVCVVSVAGKTRGGKSFLLDFFLRYLRAPDEARRSGAWIGADDEPLTGFSWRGGCERDTDGIVVWPEPIIVELGSGETSKKAAVLLMDTQGTFDNVSTMRDSSVIFAMSSLLSSVQIYNLSQNINEDSFQYLHLFTEYGKLAQEETSSIQSPFQVLQFLVRDWSYPYEYAFGAEGGNQLLENRLKITNNQAAELSDVRQHIRSVFEDTRCFLMPHPGLTVATSAAFRGHMRDISPEFKDSLLEFIPTLFAPENIIVKKIYGQEVTVRDLPQYFQSYIEMFNSDSLPTPVTVTMALSMASLEATLNAARAAYTSSMDASCGGTMSVSRAAVPRLHATALCAAKDAFTARKTVASPTLAKTKLDTLMLELDAMLHNHITINNNKITASISNSKATYTYIMDEERQCLLPEELEELHITSKNEALAAFDDSRRPRDHDDEEDIEDINDRNTLEQDLDALLPKYRQCNMERIVRRGQKAREDLEAQLRGAMARAACMHPRSLARVFSRVRTEVLTSYHGHWRNDRSAMNEHRERLNKDLQQLFEILEAENEVNNDVCVARSLEHYETIMTQLFVGEKCLHPRLLSREHAAASRSSRDHFLEQRYHEAYQEDIYVTLLQTKMTASFLIFNERNENLNKAAVEKALAEYIAIMVPRPMGGAAEGFMDMMVGVPDFTIFRRHGPAKTRAIDYFIYELRVQGSPYDDDPYLEELNKKISTDFTWLVLKTIGSVTIHGASIAYMTGTMLFRR